MRQFVHLEVSVLLLDRFKTTKNKYRNIRLAPAVEGNMYFLCVILSCRMSKKLNILVKCLPPCLESKIKENVLKTTLNVFDLPFLLLARNI